MKNKYIICDLFDGAFLRKIEKDKASNVKEINDYYEFFIGNYVSDLTKAKKYPNIKLARKDVSLLQKECKRVFNEKLKLKILKVIE